MHVLLNLFVMTQALIYCIIYNSVTTFASALSNSHSSVIFPAFSVSSGLSKSHSLLDLGSSRCKACILSSMPMFVVELGVISVACKCLSDFLRTVL